MRFVILVNRIFSNEKFKFVKFMHNDRKEFRQRNSSWPLIVGLGVVAIGTCAIRIFLPLNEGQTAGKRKELTKDSKNTLVDQLIFCKGIWLPKFSSQIYKFLSEIENFQVEDDLIVASFPKSGTTWVQEIVSLIENIHSKEKSDWAKVIMEERFPYLEYPYPGLKEIGKMKPPRMIKTHLPHHLLPSSAINGKARIIYIAREPKDVCLSYYYFVRMLSYLNYNETFEEFFNHFVKGKVGYGPWDAHVLSYWERRDNENVLFITYEDLHEKPYEVIREIANFLNKPLSDKQLEFIIKETRFEKMKNNPASNYSWWDDIGMRRKTGSQFMRKGIVGDWKNYMTDDMAEQVDQILESNPALDNIFKPKSK